MGIEQFLEELTKGNGSVLTDSNYIMMNELANRIYSTDKLQPVMVNELRCLIMACNIIYNRTDMERCPIEDGFYDLLLEKYKEYDKDFQVGSAVVTFKDVIQTNTDNNVTEIAECPIVFMDKVERNEIREDINKNIIKTFPLNINDFGENPIIFDKDISKRKHNTSHNHPELVGTLDKCKFVLIKDAIDAGCVNDPNVKILERDFFQKHVSQGIISPNEEIEVVCELKYDGISVEADCAFQVLSARTRGDTGIGEAADITPILEGYTFKRNHYMIDQQYYDKPLGVKFEAIIRKSDMAEFNKLRGREYKNPRSAIVGLFGASDGYKFRDLITLVPLAVDLEQTPKISNRIEEIELINHLFQSKGEPLRYCYFKGTLDQVLYFIKCFQDEAKIARDYLDFMYDGIVVSYIDDKIRRKLGRENFINKYSMAVKFDAQEKQTVFRGYTYTVGQHGQITPMIHYDTVEFNGTLHNKSTGSSYQRFMELGLKYGDIINVSYNNDVMPYVSKVDCAANRNNPQPLFKFTECCPVCGSKLVFSDSAKSVYCPNIECPGRSIKRMVNMLQKLNIKGFAEANMSLLKVDNLSSLCKMTKEEMISKIGNADGANLYNQIQTLKVSGIKDYYLMGSLGFSGLAYKTWQAILDKVTLQDIFNHYMIGDLEQKLRRVGVKGKTLETILNQMGVFKDDIYYIINEINYTSTFGMNSDAKKTIRFTGFRNQQLSELLTNAGYDADPNGSVTKKTDILLIPYDGFSSTKLNKISESCIVVTESEFVAHMEKYIGENLN